MRGRKAVSEVIGVIILVAILVVLTVIVAKFAFGIPNIKKIPKAQIDFVSIKRNITAESRHDGFYIKLMHRGGDSIPFKDLRVIIHSHGEHDGWAPDDWTTILGSYTKDANGVVRHAQYPNEVWEVGDYLLIKTMKEYGKNDSGAVGMLNGEKEVLLGKAITEDLNYTYNINVKIINVKSNTVLYEINAMLPEKQESGFLVK